MEYIIREIPEIRFKEFNEKYTEYRLSDLLSKYSENNKDEEFYIEDILSLSAKHGIVNRKTLLKNTYDKVNHKNYKKTRLNDFVYGKSISANYPYGLFKANNIGDGLLSTLYFTFKVNDKVFPNYLGVYFSHYNRVNNFLKKYVLVGDRYITADADFILSGKICIPSKEEQIKIINFLSLLDKRINNLERKHELLLKYKKGIMQKILSKEIRFKDLKNDQANHPEWSDVKISEILESHSIPVEVKIKENYNEIGIRSHGKGIFYKESKTGEDLGNKRVFWLKEDLFIVNIVFAWEGAVAKTTKNEIGKIASHRFPTYKAREFILNLDFILAFFKTRKGLRLLQLASPGGAGRNKTLGKSNFNNLKIHLPCYDEQVQIAKLINKLDSKIEIAKNQIEGMKYYKKGLLQNMFV